MSNYPENFDPEYTIPTVSESDDAVDDYGKLREEFAIFPDADGSCYYDLKLIGMGGMGAVFSGSDPTLQRDVAVKILREPFRHNREQIAKFVNEARITARIDHPNVVAVHQLGVNEHHGVYFSMRRISGETLQTALRKLRENDQEARKTYTLERMLDIFIAGCNAVAAAHEKEILHCDLKPANIMIGAFGEVMVLDWGLAREFSNTAVNADKISGTPAYMAPELISGETPVPDVLTDVYALGTILFSILTRHPAPFDMTQEKTILLEKVASGKSLPLRAPKGVPLPRELAAICRKAMSTDRSERYSSVAELLNDIYNYRSRRPVQAYSPNIFYRFFKLCRRHPAIPVAVIVAGLTMLLYVMTQRIIEFTHDRSLLRSAQINLNIAGNYYRKTVGVHKIMRHDHNVENLLQLVIYEKDMQLQANAALMEYFSILDSVSGISPAGMREFAATYAPQIFQHILELAITSGDRNKISEVVERCRRWHVFEAACEQNPHLNELVQLINDNTGIVTLNNSGTAASRRITITYPDQSRHETEVTEQLQLRLKSGLYRVVSSDQVIMYWNILPGSRNIFFLPENSANGFQAIPDDHFELNIPGSATVRVPLNGFAISSTALDGEFTWQEAQNAIAQIPGCRLPGGVELLKAWSTQEGKPLYMPTPDKGKVWMSNGMLFDIERQRSEAPLPGQKGRIFPVKAPGNSND